MENNVTNIPEWQERLLVERKNLLGKVLELRKAFENKEFKLNHEEWEMLRQQHCAMTDYLRVLTQRCKYYGLIDAVDLNIY